MKEEPFTLSTVHLQATISLRQQDSHTEDGVTKHLFKKALNR